MPEWNTLSKIVAESLRDVYSNGEGPSEDNRLSVLDFDGQLMQYAKEHLATAVTLTGDDVLSRLDVQMKRYVDSADNVKDLEVGNTTRRHFPSLIFHERGNDRYNTLAMFATCGWKPLNLKQQCVNYRGAIATVLSRLRYSFAVCIELQLNMSESKAYLTSPQHLMTLGYNQSSELANNLLKLADGYGLRKRWAEVVESRDQLFIDVSDDLFGVPVAV